MQELIQDLLVAIGGGSVALIGIMTIFKKLFIKLFETGIESSFEKSMEKYRNQLSRSTKAYEILLEREMRFYERMEPMVAELVPLVQDLIYYMTRDDEVDRAFECESFRKSLKRYMDLILDIKNEILIHQTYIPANVNTAATAVVKQMQDNINFWVKTSKYLFDGEYEKIDYDQAQMIVDGVLMKVARTEMAIKKRLEELSGI